MVSGGGKKPEQLGGAVVIYPIRAVCLDGTATHSANPPTSNERPHP